MTLPRPALCLAIGVMACWGPRESSEVVGRYSADYGAAHEELVLRDDRVFTQTVLLKATGRKDSVTGWWRYDPRAGYVTFGDSFMVVLDGFGALDSNYARPAKGLVSEPVEGWWGRLTIGTSEGILYTKQERQ